jgi:hypothetical protein
MAVGARERWVAEGGGRGFSATLTAKRAEQSRQSVPVGRGGCAGCLHPHGLGAATQGSCCPLLPTLPDF